jgi:Ca-activated chloride channel family protein
VGSLASKIQHPALVNLRIVQSPVHLIQSYPQDLPDLFFGEELVIFGRYRGQGNGTLIIEGERNGRRERFTARAVFPENEDANDFIPKLWASRRIGELTRQIRIEGASQSLVQQVRDLGLRYGILTEYTSYLVLEPGMAAPRDEVTSGRRISPNSFAPAAQTGSGAFARADASAKMSSAGNVAETEAVAERQMRELGNQSSQPMRRAGSKMFQLRDQVWVDLAHRDSLSITDVAPFSDAYFALARALPELSQYLSIGDQILVAGRQGSIRIAAGGTSSWRPGQLQRVVQAYRGQ